MLARDFPNRYLTPKDKYMFFYQEQVKEIKKQSEKTIFPIISTKKILSISSS